MKKYIGISFLFALVVLFAPFTARAQTSDITINITGNGTVASSADFSCTAPGCTKQLTGVTFVTLTATPDSGYTFSGWSGECTGTGTCAVILSVTARTVTATFTATTTVCDQPTIAVVLDSSNPAERTVSAGSADVVVGVYKISTGNCAVTVNSVNPGIDGTGWGSSNVVQLRHLYFGTNPTPVASSSSSVFSELNWPIPANSSITFKETVDTSLQSLNNATIRLCLYNTYFTDQNGKTDRIILTSPSIAACLPGNWVTVSNIPTPTPPAPTTCQPTVTAILDPSNPPDQTVAPGSTGVVAGIYKITTGNCPVTISSINPAYESTVMGGPADIGHPFMLKKYLYNGTNLVASNIVTSENDETANVFKNLNLAIPANSSIIITEKIDISPQAVKNSTSLDVRLSLYNAYFTDNPNPNYPSAMFGPSGNGIKANWIKIKTQTQVPTPTNPPQPVDTQIPTPILQTLPPLPVDSNQTWTTQPPETTPWIITFPTESNPNSGVSFSGASSDGYLPSAMMKFDYNYKNTIETPVKVKIVRQMVNGKGKVISSAQTYQTLKTGATFSSTVKQTVSAALPAGAYTVKVVIYDAKNKIVDQNSFPVELKKKYFTLNEIPSDTDIAWDAKVWSQVKTDVRLPANLKLRFSYVNNTGIKHVIKMVRDLIDGNGTVKATKTSKWVMTVGKKDQSTFTQSLGDNLAVGNYSIRIRAYDWTTKEILAENSAGFTVVAK